MSATSSIVEAVIDEHDVCDGGPEAKKVKLNSANAEEKAANLDGNKPADKELEPLSNGNNGSHSVANGNGVTTVSKLAESAEKDSKEEEESKQPGDKAVANDAAEAETVEAPDDSSPGEVLWCGTTKWQLLHDKKAKLPNLFSPHRMESLIGVRISKVFSGTAACHVVLVTVEGQALTFGRNQLGQLGVGDKVTSVQARPVEALRNIRVVSAACGRSHTLFLTSRGEVFACGDNRSGQLGIGSVANGKDTGVPTPKPMAMPTVGSRRIAQVEAGGDFSLLIDSSGMMFTCGHPENGQLGHGSDSQYFEGTKLVHKMESRPAPIVSFLREEEGRGGRPGAKSVIEGVRVIAASCGPSHCACLDSEGRLWTWGFGGYGRLGHNSTRNELRPRLVNYFSNTRQCVDRVSCGGAYTIATTAPANSSAPPVTYLWGQQKSSGEANMYPKALMDLSGWSVRRLSAGNRSCAVLADTSCITWGPSPTFGELGHGDMVKSSARPMVCKALERVRVAEVAMGYAQCVFLVPLKSDGSDAEEKLGKYPVCRDK
ncbi:hypothetical protein BOX15_Mlig028728g2 [Macrostomum lignano]|uniref:Uncharacterized protein n=1 Tax=Macrostomum lignano TaxID=282301 RepID=A0A267FZ06_9PLAT|nr:hypothetical protein BOX15_Mlig028728g2 [Macrostomum lignano]